MGFGITHVDNVGTPYSFEGLHVKKLPKDPDKAPLVISIPVSAVAPFAHSVWKCAFGGAKEGSS